MNILIFTAWFIFESWRLWYKVTKTQKESDEIALRLQDADNKIIVALFGTFVWYFCLIMKVVVVILAADWMLTFLGYPLEIWK